MACQPNIVFDANALMARYQCDMESFRKENGLEYSSTLTTPPNIESLRVLKEQYKSLQISEKSRLFYPRKTQRRRRNLMRRTRVQFHTLSTHRKSKSGNLRSVTVAPSPSSRFLADYIHDDGEIPFPEMSLTSKGKALAWMYRHTMFFGILLLVHQLLSSRNIEGLPENMANIRRDHLADFNTISSKIELSILGSNKPDSDIDIGVACYAPENTTFLGNLIYFIEWAFLWIYEKPSLFYDIEFYADFMTYEKTIEGAKSIARPTRWLVDTFSLSDTQYDFMMPYAISSFLRNLYHAHGNLDRIKKMKWEDFFQYVPSSYRRWIKPVYFPKAKQMTIQYLQITNYELGIAIHKTKINECSQAMLAYIQNPKSSNLLLDVMQKSAEVNLYREESYLCLPTILHVAKIMQQDAKTGMQSNYNKNCTRLKRPQTFIPPVCYVNQFGYQMSIIEQLGYIARFELAKKENKIKKYRERIADANRRILEIQHYISPLPSKTQKG